MFYFVTLLLQMEKCILSILPTKDLYNNWQMPGFYYALNICFLDKMQYLFWCLSWTVRKLYVHICYSNWSVFPHLPKFNVLKLKTIYHFLYQDCCEG